MAIPGSFRELQDQIFPRWAQRPKWAAFIGVLSAKKDELADRMAGAIDARLVERAPDDALDDIGGNSYLERALVDTAATFRAYLRRPFERWWRSSTPAGLVAELAHLGYPSANVITWRDLVDNGADGNVAFGGFSTFGFVLIRPPHPFLPPGLWDDGALWDAAPYQWDITAPPGSIEELRRTVAKFKPGYLSIRYIEIWLRVGLFGLPLEIVRIPVRESWEKQANGGFLDFYNSGNGL